MQRVKSRRSLARSSARFPPGRVNGTRLRAIRIARVRMQWYVSGPSRLSELFGEGPSSLLVSAWRQTTFPLSLEARLVAATLDYWGGRDKSKERSSLGRSTRFDRFVLRYFLFRYEV